MPPVHISRLLSVLLLGSSLLAACGGEDSATLVREARAKAAAGDTKAAMIQLKNAVAADEKNAEARFELGKLYLDQLDLASAEKEFRRAREAGYAAAQVNPMIARALLGQREFQRVLDELPASTDDTPDGATLAALRAMAYLGLGNKNEARTTLERISPNAARNPEVQLASARLALADGKPDEATQAIDLAIQLEPKNIEALLLKADLARVTGKPAEARQGYQAVLKIAPRHSLARLALADIAIAENQLADARREVDTALKFAPNNLQARYTQALIDFRENKTEAARDHLAVVLKNVPDNIPALLLGGSIEFSLGHLQTAETYLTKVVTALPDNRYALRLLAATQLRLGRADDAARTLAPALKAAPDAGVLVVAGEIAQARRNFAEAAALFEQAARLSPNSAAIRTELGIARLAQGDSRAIAELQAAAGMAGSGSRPDTFLIISQLERKQFDAALASIAAFEKKQGASPVIWNYRGAAWLGKQDVARARDSFEQALKLDPGYFAAAANLAQLDSQAGQPAAARQRFEGVLKADPKNLNAMLALADLALRAKDEAGYVGWLEKAAATQPQAIQPRVTLARYLVAKGDKAKALNVANEAIAAQPDSPAALDLLGTVQLAAGDAVNAQSTYRKLAERQSGQTGPIVKLATAQIVAKDLEGARKSLQNALRLQPDSLVALQMLGGVEIQTRRFDQALTIARQIQQQQPKSGQGHALEAQAHYALRNYPKALDAYERAFKLEPSGALLVQELQVYTAQGKPEIGERRILAWLTDHPKEFPLLGAVAESLLKRRQYASAADHYFTLLRQFPDNIAILNNLGWALAELGDKRAPDYAMKAYKLSPGNPLAADTLGWALLKTGEAAKSLEYFRQALQKSPDNPDIQYHHALALNLTGDSMRARNELKRLFASGLRFEGESDARALLNRLDTAPLSKP